MLQQQLLLLDFLSMITSLSSVNSYAAAIRSFLHVIKKVCVDLRHLKKHSTRQTNIFARFPGDFSASHLNKHCCSFHKCSQFQLPSNYSSLFRRPAGVANGCWLKEDVKLLLWQPLWFTVYLKKNKYKNNKYHMFLSLQWSFGACSTHHTVSQVGNQTWVLN